jgi:septal ring factor EnvC (AmiA/AmiB activator)
MRKLFFVISILVWPIIGLSQENSTQEHATGELQEKLKSIRKKINTEQGFITSQRSAIQGLEEELREIDSKTKTLASEREVRATHLEQLREGILKLDQATTSGAEQLKERGARFRERIVALYKINHSTAPIVMLLDSSPQKMLKRFHYLQAVANFDHHSISALEESYAKLDSERQELARLEADEQQEMNRIGLIKKSLAEQSVGRGKKLSELKSKVQNRERSLEKLRVVAGELEETLSNLMGGAVVTEQPELVQPTLIPEVKLNGIKTKSLTFPVKGKIVQGFGQSKDGEFKELVEKKGLEVLAGIGEKVRAVAAGKVLMTENLPGFGNVIILDHGARYYSLYGRLASTLGAEGDIVKEGDTIGVTGEQDERGRNLYFELRLRGRAIDPMSYFKH